MWLVNIELENARSEMLAAMNERREAELVMLRARIRMREASERYDRAMKQLSQFTLQGTVSSSSSSK